MATIPDRLAKMQSAVQLAGFHYIVCLKAVPSNADHSLKIGKREYTFQSISTADSRTLHVEFQTWATIAILRDLIETFSIFLVDVYRDATTANPTGNFSATVDQFERKGIEDQLDILRRDFGVDHDWISRLVGFNRARNCMAHRAGIVGLRDATEGKELVLRWLTMNTEIMDDMASPPKVETIGVMTSLIRAQHVEGTKSVRATILDREKRVSVGQALRFLPNEFLEICGTFQWAAAAFNGLADRKI